MYSSQGFASWLCLHPVALQVANDPAHDDVLHHAAVPFMNRSFATFLPARRTRMDPDGYSIRWVGPHMLVGWPTICAQTCQNV
jgi:hypothetical protein